MIKSSTCALAAAIRHITFFIHQSIPSVKFFARLCPRSAVRNDVIACLRSVAYAAIMIVDAHVVDRHECDKSYDFEGLTDTQ